MTTIAVCPGSFDPITLGHVDVIERARTMFDEVIVAVAYNSAKKSLFDLDVRVELARSACQHIDNVRIEAVPGLLADFCAAEHVTAIIKGLRGSADFDAELAMSLMNRHLCGVETAFVMGDPRYNHVASSLVKDIARHGGSLEGLVPDAAKRALENQFKRS